MDGLVSCEIQKKGKILLTYQDGTKTDFVISIYNEFEDLFRRIIQLQKEAPAVQEKAGQAHAATKAETQEKGALAPAKPQSVSEDAAAQKFKSQAEAVWKKTAQEEAARRQAEMERISRDAAIREKAERERAAREKAEQERAEQEKAARERAEQERAARERIAREKVEREKAAQEKAEREKTEQERVAREKATRKRAARERAEQEKAAREKAEQEGNDCGKEGEARQQRIEALKEQAFDAWDDNPAMAVQYLREAAGLGDASSTYELADSYCYGMGTDCDIKKAKLLYRKAADMGVQEGVRALEMIEEYEKMDADELFDLAHSSATEPMDAVMYVQMASDRGLDDQDYIDFQVYRASEYAEQEQYFYAFPYYQRAAQKGHSDSQYKLGILYLFDEGWEADAAAAEEWFRKAAAQGHGEARRAIEQMRAAQQRIERMETSKSVMGASPYAIATAAQNAFHQENYVESYCLCCYIVRRGFREKTSAQTLMATMYQKGLGAMQCKWLARKIYKALSEEGNDIAQFELGEIYWSEKCYKDAADQYEKAAGQGLGLAQLRLADIYDAGVGREKDPVKAAYWYEAAAEKNFRRAQETISQMYKKGIGVPKDKKLAKKWAEMAKNWSGY